MATCVTWRGHHGDLRLQNFHDIVVLNASVQTRDLRSLRGRTDDATIRTTELFHLDTKIGEVGMVMGGAGGYGDG